MHAFLTDPFGTPEESLETKGCRAHRASVSVLVRDASFAAGVTLAFPFKRQFAAYGFSNVALNMPEIVIIRKLSRNGLTGSNDEARFEFPSAVDTGNAFALRRDNSRSLASYRLFDSGLILSRSRTSCLTIWSATSALAPLYLAPLLSFVVVQITSPSVETSRTAKRASFTVSVDA